MKDGVGIAKSLRDEAKRFTQQAVGEFFDGQFISFVVDAGTAMEHLAKWVVAERSPLLLYKKKTRRALKRQEVRALCGAPEAPPEWSKFCAIVNDVANKQAISVGRSTQIASWLCRPERFDFDAFDRVRSARNAAVHAVETPFNVDAVAADWLRVMAVLGRRLERFELWGYWEPVASERHMNSRRTTEADAEVRVRRSFGAWHGRPTQQHRRAAIALSPTIETLCRPVCRNPAALTSVYKPHLFDASDKSLVAPVLDCLYCGLVLEGDQIEYAISCASAPVTARRSNHGATAGAGLAI